MKSKYPIDIEIGKTYLPSQIIEKMNRYPNLDITFGHIRIEDEKEKKHKYFIDREFIKSLNTIPIKVYTVIAKPNCQNFAYRLLENKNIKEILEEIEENNKLCCIIDETDLAKANYNYKSFKKAITLINKVFKANGMTFRASSHPEGIKVTYKKIKEKENN
mgnify:CR=1 FL=1